MTTTTRSGGSRSTARLEARRFQFMDAASKMILEQGCLPISLADLARRIGVSKGLIYSHFTDQHDLLNAILLEHFEALNADGIDEASQGEEIASVAESCALIYFEHTALNGPLLHTILRDPYASQRLTPQLRRLRDRPMMRMARLARKQLHLSASETITALNLVMTIPEEAGRWVHDQKIDAADARSLCLKLVREAVLALTPH
ncbi:TetR/AcrR family transcriptional regulator [Phenylobacterium sp.]|uniref:TetR/AcrR family transcriptional regulator n=1 Tax=Phenylobacterium sp. TaxID=1871053 RepID=UPI0035AF4495